MIQKYGITETKSRKANGASFIIIGYLLCDVRVKCENLILQ